jgi:hypothetical protein
VSLLVIVTLALLALGAVCLLGLVWIARQDRRRAHVWPPAGRHHYRRPRPEGAPPMSLDDITSPADLDDAAAPELIQAWTLHRAALVDAHHGIGEPAPVGRLRASALGVLAIGEQLARRVAAERWMTVVEALAYGAHVPEVARALAVTPGDVVAGVHAYAEQVPADRRAELLALLQDRPR